MCYNGMKRSARREIRAREHRDIMGGDRVKNKVPVTIAGKEYTMVAVEDDNYVRQVASYVDGQIRDILEQSHLSQTDAAVLAALNIADQYYREQAASENLRRQVKEGLEEAAKLKTELSEAKREIFRLQTKK